MNESIEIDGGGVNVVNHIESGDVSIEIQENGIGRLAVTLSSYETRDLIHLLEESLAENRRRDGESSTISLEKMESILQGGERLPCGCMKKHPNRIRDPEATDHIVFDCDHGKRKYTNEGNEFVKE